ncbi:unnamed protein product [Arctogadus glacialis]
MRHTETTNATHSSYCQKQKNIKTGSRLRPTEGNRPTTGPRPLLTEGNGPTRGPSTCPSRHDTYTLKPFSGERIKPGQAAPVCEEPGGYS